MDMPRPDDVLLDTKNEFVGASARGGGFGQRGFNYLQRRRVVLVGSDIPGIEAADIRLALRKFRLGPALRM
ncbi:hypothetical protein [Acidocella aromatica]|uniref:Uncharacterized protein n=1 Tax=Acidocella aromatica TaxID=1303579 RepID=A0A840VQP2_9PROT|nr:hypothetical protein [Acidocella aromatica]MBB5374429.1 hypothetical protein [Acidocella aromatica]